MISDLNIEKLSEILVLANTPYFIIRNYLNDDSIKIVSENQSSKEIICKIKKLIQEKPSLKTIVAIYALIVALMIKGDPESEQFLLKLQDYNIQWGKYFSNYYFSKKRPQIIESVKLDYRLPQHNKTFSNDMLTTFDRINNQPKIREL